MRLGVLSREKLKIARLTTACHGRIMSLDQLGSQRATQLLIFSSCLWPGRVRKLEKFINFCLKVGHSANLKRSKSTWRQLIVPWNVQNHKIKSSGKSRNRNDLQQLLISAAFVRSRLITNSVYTWVTHVHITVPTITCSLHYE